MRRFITASAVALMLLGAGAVEAQLPIELELRGGAAFPTQDLGDAELKTGGGAGDGNDTSTLSILVVAQSRQGFNSAAALSTITFVFIFAVAFLFIKALGVKWRRTVYTYDLARMTATLKEALLSPTPSNESVTPSRASETSFVLR